ncbi:urea carboxylase-associated family protein [Pseudorhodobacter sp.]|uniref:urea carboxylase-associated family protein n=1 Tax=Pseudorhodobacter sp. TaxID=1934400 RepID=UPI0026495115|nr:urea carboxylase-associated family protein [Pseudorhodobacter sp.]MDN5787934.1 urea carboxylase-associated family protein [Pseudorhodobacter sp.]
MTASHHILPARHGAAYVLNAGEHALVRNPYGNQVVDTWALALANPEEHSAMEHTRSVNSNIFFDNGQQVVSIHRRPMLTLVEDTSPGRHDTLLCPCSSAIYRELGCTAPHRSCTDNFHEAIGNHGVSLSFTPASLNLFMNVPVAADGSLDRLPPVSRPGDHVLLRAEMDVLLVLSACPQDITPINGADHTPRDIELEIRREGAA